MPRTGPPAPLPPTSLPPYVPAVKASAFPKLFSPLIPRGLASTSKNPFLSLCSVGLTQQAWVVHTLHSPKKIWPLPGT